LWPFGIEDLKLLGGKLVYTQLCSGAVNHVGIRQLQLLLLKICFVCGVDVRAPCSFTQLVPPTEEQGWRVSVEPKSDVSNEREYDYIILADGVHNSIEGFGRKKVGGLKQAIGLTANFVNKGTHAELQVAELPGLALHFNRELFKGLERSTGVSLENIVYYRGETHYFVCTARKSSLLAKGVLKEDLPREAVAERSNVDREKLYEYNRELAQYLTSLPPEIIHDFAPNARGEPDVDLFDFTTMYQSEASAKVLEKNGFRVAILLVGDSLLNPFWPKGTGAAHATLSALDTAWMMKRLADGDDVIEVMREREGLYQLLITSDEHAMRKDYKNYTIDPTSRYPHAQNVQCKDDVTHLYEKWD